MSSLMQFEGTFQGNKVGLMFVLIDNNCNDLDQFQCSKCGRIHTRIGVAYRRPVDMLGCWVRFQYLGALHAPDLSVPISVNKYPLGTVIMTEEDTCHFWNS